MWTLIVFLLLTFTIQAEACLQSVYIKAHQVYDGDTIQNVKFDLGFDVVVTKTIRLRGVDAPEIRTVDRREKKKGIASKLRLQSLIANCEHVRIAVYGEGKFGRSLADVFCGNKKLNDILVREGHAKVYWPAGD